MLRHLIQFCLALSTLSLAACRDESVGTGPHISVQLVASKDVAAIGKEFHVGVHFKPDPGWHVYWKNPGDSGLAPKFTWKLPAATSLREPLWPYPERITVGPLVNYGYGETLIAFPATVESEGAAFFEVALQWLVCKDECLPGQARLSLNVPVDTEEISSSTRASLFSETLAKVPFPLQKTAVAVEEQDSQIVLSIIPQEGVTLPSTVTFFPEDPRVVDNATAQSSSRINGMVKVTLRRAHNRTEPISRIRGVLVSEEGFSSAGGAKAVAIDTNPHDPPKSPNPAPSMMTVPSSTSMPINTFETPGFGLAMLFAVLGGLILNLMPCVFPVLSIKILSFIDHAKDSRTKIRMHGVSFTAGVLASFWILAIALLALRSSGQQLGWGFQLQSPLFIVGMIFIFFGLGMLFLSDVAVGQTIQRLAGSSNLPTSYIGSFLNGALATAVATPCTGPFMSSAIAATLTLPAIQSFLIFTCLGIGMSLPYLILSCEPRLLKFLPRPGMWMETFKQLMAFPLFASSVWLLRVFARQMGMEPTGLTVLMGVMWGLFFSAFGFWALVQSGRLRSHTSRRFLQLLGVLSLGYGIISALPTEAEISHSRERARAGSTTLLEPDEHGLVWEPYSEARLTNLLREKRPIYIDFTAEWCITCQVNERVVFSSTRVRELIKEKNIALLKGDWTSMNPDITAALKTYGRNGVPLNVLHRGGQDKAPVIFPNILTPGIVIEELEKL